MKFSKHPFATTAMRPGATRADTVEVERAILEKWGFADQRAGGAGHFVGMSVHDVGDESAPFAPGMVIAVEPMIMIDDQELHCRIEDTVLITPGGAEVLTVGLPREVVELLAPGRERPARGRRAAVRALEPG